MYCIKCGHEINDNAVECSHCGTKTPAAYSQENQPSTNGGFAVLGFFIPLAGLIIYLIYNDKNPARAKAAGKGALIGVCVKAVFLLIVFIFYFVTFLGLFSRMSSI